MNYITNFYRKDKIGRKEFFVWGVLIAPVLPLLVMLLGLGIVDGLSSLGYPLLSDGLSDFLLSIFLLSLQMLFTLTIYLLSVFKRSRDIGINSLWNVLAFIPLTSIFYGIFLLSKRGSSPRIN